MLNTVKEELHGLGKVFSFTFLQFTKSRANIVSCVIMLVFALCTSPVLCIFGPGKAEPASKAEFVLDNQTDIALSADAIGWEEYAGDYSGKIICTVGTDENGFVITPSAADADADVDLEGVAQACVQALQQALIAQSGISQDRLERLTAPVRVNSDTMEEYLSQGEEHVDWGARFAVQYAYAMLLMILCLFSGIYIIRSVVEEKASRLIEFLMVSVKPLALIVGKILAVMAYIFLLMASMVLAFALSVFATGRFLADAPSLRDLMAFAGGDLSGFSLGIETVGIVIVSALLGYLLFAVIGGISGACCSKMEDVESANGSVTALIMVGYLVSCFAGSASGGALSVFLSLCPVVSVFCAPVQYVVGNVSFWILLLSWLLQIVYICLLARFSAGIYAELLIHRGSRLKIKDLFSLAKAEHAEKNKGV